MFLVLSCIRHWFVLIFTVSYLFLFFITGLHSGGGLSAHVTDVTRHISCACPKSGECWPVILPV